MSTILVNNIKSYTGTTVTISGSNISVTGNTTLGDGAGGDTITINGNVTASGDISASGTVFADRFQSATGGTAIDFNDSVEIEGNISASGDITASNLQIDGDIIHGGDADTKIALSTDTMNFTVGGETMITLDENQSGGGSNQDEIFFNPNGNDVVFRVAGANSTLIYTSASADVMAIGGNQSVIDLNARLTVSGNLKVHEGHITASGNILSSGTITAEHFLSTDDAVITDDLTVGGNVTSSITSTGSFGKLELDSENLLINNGFQKVLISGSITSTASFGQLLVAPDGGQDDQLTINAVGTVSGSHISTGSFGHIISDSDIEGTLSSATQTNITALGVLTSLSSSGTITALNFNATGSEGNITASGTITVGGNVTGSNLSTASFGRFETDFFGEVESPQVRFKFWNSGSSTVVKVEDDYVQILATEGLLSSHGWFTGNVTASGDISSSATITAEDLLVMDDAVITDDLTVGGMLTVGGIISGSSLSITGSAANISCSGDILNTGTITTTEITASGNISSSGTVATTAVVFPTTVAVSVDDLHCGSITGTKFSVQTQLQAALADGATSAEFTVGNTDIALGDVIMGTIHGSLMGGLSQSSMIISTRTANSASFVFNNESGLVTVDDTAFTASFVIL